jgi:hypothetical protein
MVRKILETIYSTFFTSCCFPYVHFCELYLSCVYCHLSVFVVSYVYFLYLMCIYVSYKVSTCAHTEGTVRQKTSPEGHSPLQEQ